jgi:hypothetical protein
MCKNKRGANYQKMVNFETPNKVGEMISTDVIGPVTYGNKKYYIIVAVDRLSRFIFGSTTVASPTTNILSAFIKDKIAKKHNLKKGTILTDNDAKL